MSAIEAMTDTSRNWAGNFTYHAANIHRPENVEQVRTIVRRSGKLRALGSRHSFNSIADTDADHLSTERLNRIVSLDRRAMKVTVEAGIKYGELGVYLHREGFAIPNLASLPHISVAGAIATATHGSGENVGNLATAVSALEMVTADGELISLARGTDKDFAGAVVALGALGVVTKVTLDISPAFDVRQTLYQNLPWSQFEEHFDEIEGSAYSVSVFTDWRSDTINQLWMKQLATEKPLPKGKFFGATPAARDLHPIASISAESCTPQMGIAGPWHERLPHFKMNFTPSSGDELQSEYFVPRDRAVEAIRAMFRIREQISPLLLISEIRTIAADDLWMSTCYQRPSVALHFTWKPDWPAVKRLLPVIEETLAPFDARPHWGKLFTMAPQTLQSLYPKLPDFRRLVGEYDPAGKFRNAFIDRFIFDVDSPAA